MNIGLVDVDGHNFPNLALMKISAWHKAKGDTVEWCLPLSHYDIVYVSKVFGDEYSTMDMTAIQADKIIYGGTGFEISIVDGKEVYKHTEDNKLPNEIEHIYPDYSLYPEFTKNTAYGFLTRGCPNNCSFCIVSKKEGLKSHKVADLSEFWKGQKLIKLLDPNILACKEHAELLQQLANSGATVDFTQGLDARFITKENIVLLKQIKADTTYEKQFYSVFQSGKNIGRIYGFPFQRGAWCNDRLKMQAIAKCKVQGIEYIGIANDEPKRFKKLTETKLSPLRAIGWDEDLCGLWCQYSDLLSPTYCDSCRDGCWFCHNQGVEQLRALRKKYPELWELLLKWDKDSPVSFKADGHTVHDYDKRFFLEDEGLILPEQPFKWDMLNRPLQYQIKF